MNKKIAFFDIDGTLIAFDGEKTVMPESTKEAIKRFREKGNLAFICSGRPIRFILQEFGNGMFDGYIAGNGAYILFEDKVIYDRLIPIDKLKELEENLNKLGAGYTFNGAYEGYAYNLSRERIDGYNAQFQTGEPYLREGVPIEEVKAQMFDIHYRDEEHLQQCKDFLGDNLIFNTHGPHMSADISFREWNKSHGIKYFIEYSGISIEDSYAFGDGSNDIDMLKTVKTGIAMGNGIDELKAVAAYVTSDIFENGIYNAMLKYNLI
jgi:Cof subfamily protein (haloacid dehalogenase superfamily)